MIRVLLILLLPVVALSNTPIDYQSWNHGGGQTSTQLGGPPRNYPSGDGWLNIENDWITLDTIHTNRRGVLKTDVNNSGQIFTSIIMGDDTVTIGQRLLSLKWFRSTDSAWLPIDNTPNWIIPSVDSNVISWPNVFPGVDVKVSKFDGLVDYSLHFKPSFLDSAVILYNQRSDSANIYLANIIACELVGVADVDSSLGTITERVLAIWGRRALKMNGFSLEYPRGRGDPVIKVYQRHRRIGGKLYIVEFVKMSDLKWAHEQHPTETLWHHSSTVLQSTALWDNMLNSDDDNTGTGGRTTDVFFVGFSGLFLIGYEGLDAIVGSDTRDSAVVRFRSVADFFDPGPAELYGVWKWQATEDGSSYSTWKATAGGWGTDGCNSTNDAGSFNTTNNGGDDREATAINTVSFAAVDTWYEILDDSWFAFVGDSVIWAVKAGTGADGTVAMSEHGTFPLIVTIYYTAAPAGDGMLHRRRKLG